MTEWCVWCNQAHDPTCWEQRIAELQAEVAQLRGTDADAARVAQIEARLVAVTKGPFHAAVTTTDDDESTAIEKDAGGEVVAEVFNPGDVPFWLHAVEDVQYLVGRINARRDQAQE